MESLVPLPALLSPTPARQQSEQRCCKGKPGKLQEKENKAYYLTNRNFRQSRENIVGTLQGRRFKKKKKKSLELEDISLQVEKCSTDEKQLKALCDEIPDTGNSEALPKVSGE